MEQFDAFCEAVCRQVRHATPKERRAIRAELTGHLEDRAEILLSRGLEEAQAESAAVAAMGDPECVGRELNRQYPLGWLLLSRTLLVLLAAAVLVNLFTAFGVFDRISTNLEARTSRTLRYTNIYETEILAAWDMDREAEIGDTGRLRAYHACLTRSDGGAYYAYVFFSLYDQNPLAPSPRIYFDVLLTNAQGEQQVDGGGGHFYALRAPVNRGDPYVVLSYDRLGSAFRWEIPLEWEGAL